MENFISELKELIARYEGDDFTKEFYKYFMKTNTNEYLKVNEICKVLMEANPELSCRQIEHKLSKLLGKSYVKRINGKSFRIKLGVKFKK